MIGWLFYILGIILFMAHPILGMGVFGIGMLFHFKWWAVGIVAFFIGAGWKKPM